MNGESRHDGPAWFAGATFGSRGDQLERFLRDGIWENGYEDRHLDLVRSMRPGDRIAIKSSYTRRHGVGFDNRGHSVSVMAIRATGTVTENPNDGRHVRVQWEKVDPPREWYFYTFRGTLWRVLPGEWAPDGLIAFAFDGQPQDIDRFRNDPYWSDRFGPNAPERHHFQWTRFYEAIADGLLAFRSDRPRLVAGIRDIASRVDGLGHLADDLYRDGTKGFVRDICPFTAMGIFNRNITEGNRRTIASELAALLDVEEPVPASFEGIPLLNNLKSWYFPRESERESDHIDALWSVFEAGIRLADDRDDREDRMDAFVAAFDGAIGRPGVSWNLTFGLYWARPWDFQTLDTNSRRFISDRLVIEIGRHGPKKLCSAEDYLGLVDALKSKFLSRSYSVHSFPELSLAAWSRSRPDAADAKDASGGGTDVEDAAGDDSGEDASGGAITIDAYGVDDILREGCFLDRPVIDRLLRQWLAKRNLILQGPPGTGKTWLAKRLAFALIGQRDDSRVRAVQFHPNLSYEDFVRGWRPSGDGRLSLVDGTFLEAVKAASNHPAERFVFVIEEINRGNPAQIFGELLTLLETDKRTPREALELSHPDPDGRRRPVHIPENLYVIGTMNIADRSLALVDLALRRRFAFVDLEPQLGPGWMRFVVEERAMDETRASDIDQRIRNLNEVIAADKRLGKQFRIGHSFVTPADRLETGQTRRWFEDVVETEIRPLLAEYWFDDPQEVGRACERLLAGW